MITPALALLPHGADWIWILIIVMVLFGAKKLPELARGLGSSLKEFKKGRDESEQELQNSTVVDTAKPPGAPTHPADEPARRS